MNPNEIFAVLFAAIGLLVAIVALLVALNALRRISELKSCQAHDHSKIESLTRVQLQLHRREVEKVTQARYTAGSAAIQVSLEGSEKKASFVVRNWGYGPANNVDVRISPLVGNKSPLASGEYERKFPLPVLEPGGEASLEAALSFDTGSTFDVNWGWQDEDGSMRSSSARVSL